MSTISTPESDAAKFVLLAALALTIVLIASGPTLVDVMGVVCVIGLVGWALAAFARGLNQNPWS